MLMGASLSEACSSDYLLMFKVRAYAGDPQTTTSHWKELQGLMKSILEGNKKVLMRSLRGCGMIGLQYILQVGININEEVTIHE